MEFKVIFIGFALHCVLNTVLICKSVVTKGQEEQIEVVAAAQERNMMQAINEGPGELKRLRLEVSNTNGENSIRVGRMSSSSK